MLLKKNNKKLQDPLADGKLFPNGKPEIQDLLKGKRKASRIVRIDELKKRLEDGGEVDPQEVISMYMPRSRFRRFGAALLGLNRLYLLLLGLLLALALTFLLAVSQEEMGSFTINLNRLDLYSKGISISETGDFRKNGARLEAQPMQNATNMSIEELPANINEVDGGHNGKNYMAYTFYVRNSGKEDIAYVARVNIETATKGVDQALRVAVWRNDQRTVYAAATAGGGTEAGCEAFVDDYVACMYAEDTFQVGDVDKYTVAIWLEGDDPDCTDEIIGGNIRMSMALDTEDDEDEDSTFRKLVKDIKNVLTGKRSIQGSAQTDIPQYYLDNEVTWENRRNK